MLIKLGSSSIDVALKNDQNKFFLLLTGKRNPEISFLLLIVLNLMRLKTISSFPTLDCVKSMETNLKICLKITISKKGKKTIKVNNAKLKLIKRF
jgi:hypothetical protein